MRIATQLVFDQTISGTSPVTAYSNAAFNALLASGEAIVVHVLTDSATGTSPQLTVTLDHGNDNVNFINKGTLISAYSLTANTFQQAIGQDTGATPMGSYARVVFSLTGTGAVSARVRAYACVRGQQASGAGT